MINIRNASAADLDFLLDIDEQGEGYTGEPTETSAEQRSHQRSKFESFLVRSGQGAWIAEDSVSKTRAGMVMCVFRDLADQESQLPGAELFHEIRQTREAVRFCEVFELWVHPDYRRQGLATQLKCHLEAESLARGLGLIYTHTESTNPHVIELNLKLGYREVRRGPIWDDVERVSLVKALSCAEPSVL